MTFRRFALHNVLRNKRLYLAYFLSSMFTVMVFFTFVNFAFHPALSGEGMNGKVTFGMTVAGGIIYVFSLSSVVLTMLAILLLGSAYAVSLYVSGPAVVFALFPVALIVIIGTYLFFTQLSVFVIRKLKEKQGIFWKGSNMLLFSDLSHRMKDNARAFFMVAIISTVAFSAIGTLVGLNSFLTDGLKKANPYGLTTETEIFRE